MNETCETRHCCGCIWLGLLVSGITLAFVNTFAIGGMTESTCGFQTGVLLESENDQGQKTFLAQVPLKMTTIEPFIEDESKSMVIDIYRNRGYQKEIPEEDFTRLHRDETDWMNGVVQRKKFTECRLNPETDRFYICYWSRNSGPHQIAGTRREFVFGTTTGQICLYDSKTKSLKM